jgi:hypothetical protein
VLYVLSVLPLEAIRMCLIQSSTKVVEREGDDGHLFRGLPYVNGLKSPFNLSVQTN